MNIHIFDIDHTLIKRSTTHAFIRAGLNKGFITLPQIAKIPWKWILYKLAVIEPEFIEIEVRKYKNIPQKVLTDLSIESFDNYGKKHLYAEGIALINELKEKGERIIVATSSVDFFIEPIMKFLGIDEYISTRLEFVDGVTTGRTIGNAVFGKNKLNAVVEYFRNKGLSLDNAAFYSDSYNDLPLLEACGQAVPVNPDSRLRKEAKRQGWTCRNFHKTLG
ncbi:MAG: HAD family phosphatase [Spirochaetales bacterium]|nr:HAD family phosphatase [Spirochaetales bacterium]